ncbi:unnamed protein product [Arctia plantaginis]|uniref:Uncharacterized protein n=1 Tax=Arctia plantaginis TaxID=874455 RepID=A0A8S0Z5N7_ARCPL|nr:unnamed protein product [Arctia plantaginis]CAB3228154.1 unnamed protein product [Arctia plantaginis]
MVPVHGVQGAEVRQDAAEVRKRCSECRRENKQHLEVDPPCRDTRCEHRVRRGTPRRSARRSLGSGRAGPPLQVAVRIGDDREALEAGQYRVHNCEIGATGARAARERDTCALGTIDARCAGRAGGSPGLSRSRAAAGGSPATPALARARARHAASARPTSDAGARAARGRAAVGARLTRPSAARLRAPPAPALVARSAPPPPASASTLLRSTLPEPCGAQRYEWRRKHESKELVENK